MFFYSPIFLCYFSGFWKCQDCPQQQLQSLWQVHSSQLPGKRCGQRVRPHHPRIAYNKTKYEHLLLIVFIVYFFQSVCGEIPSGKVEAGLSREQRAVSKAALQATWSNHNYTCKNQSTDVLSYYIQHQWKCWQFVLVLTFSSKWGLILYKHTDLRMMMTSSLNSCLNVLLLRMPMLKK